MRTERTRLERFKRLCEHYLGGIPDEHGPYDWSGEEDAAEVLYGDDPLLHYCVVTFAGEWAYLKLTDSMIAAQLAAVENCADNIHAESPVEIVDLDTGDSWTPDWSSLDWHQSVRTSR